MRDKWRNPRLNKRKEEPEGSVQTGDILGKDTEDERLDRRDRKKQKDGEICETRALAVILHQIMLGLIQKGE